jgi:hypothetical protein
MPSYPPTTEPISSATPVTASLLPPIVVPTHGAGGSFSVIAKTRISSPPKVVFDLIRDTTRYEKWNSFTPRWHLSDKSPKPSEGVGEGGIETDKEGWLEVGSVANIEVFMAGDGLVEGSKKSREQGIVVTILESILDEGKSGYRLAWKSTGWSHWQMHSERVMEFVETEDGGTAYACWETFGGILGATVKLAVGGTLVDRFGDYARDVKEYLERGNMEKGYAELTNGAI